MPTTLKPASSRSPAAPATNLDRRHCLVRSMALGVGFLIPPHVSGQPQPSSRDQPRVPRRVDSEPGLMIDEPGFYRLNEDRISRGGWSPEGWCCTGRILLKIISGDVDVDLNGRTIGTTYGNSGIIATMRSCADRDKRRSHLYPHCAHLRNIAIRNGVLMFNVDTSGQPLVFSNQWSGDAELPFRRGEQPYGGPVPQITDYPANNYLLDGLRINGRYSGPFLEGAGSVVRNCIIETDGLFGLGIAGPNALIENCDIVLRKSRDVFIAKRELILRSAIVLRDGHGAIIRNNRIRIEASELPYVSKSILIHDGAKGIRVEGNTIVTAQPDSIALIDGAEVEMLGNRFEKPNFWQN